MTLTNLVEFLSNQLADNPSMGESPIFAQNGGEIDGLGMGQQIFLTHSPNFEVEEASRWERFAAMFLLADIPVVNHWEIPNQYWPQAYTKLRLENPWWLVETPAGLVRIGWRKRVMSIDWSHTKIRSIVTEDDVTKDETMVHVYSTEKAVEYLKTLGQEMAARDLA